MNRPATVWARTAVIAALCTGRRELGAQAAGDAKFSALASLAEARMKEYGVPGVAAILTNANTGWRVIQDVEREALASYLGASYALNQAIAHRGLVETLPSVEPLARQPDPSPYVGTYARPNNIVVVRAEGGTLFVQERPNSGRATAEMPVAFFGPDHVVVTGGTEKGQSIEFVRDAAGHVNWVRVVGRVAVRTP
ncbi:MAG: hypothetical protein ACREPM_21305 [Gemmatimonadaceae bacterium]